MFKRTIVIIGYYCGLIILFLSSFIPLRLGYLISDILTFIFKRNDRVTEVTKRNLRRAFPDYTSEQVDEICEKYIRCCIDYFFEFLAFTHFSSKQVQKRCLFRNAEIVNESLKTNSFAICYAGHMINYEFLTSFPMVLEGYGMCHLFLDDTPNVIQSWIMSTRSKYGAVNIPTTNPLRTLIRLKKEIDSSTSAYPAYVFGTLADMDTFEKHPHESDFFSYQMEMATGSERIGRKYDMEFFFAFIERPQRGYYVVTLHKMKPQVDPKTYKYAYTDEFVRLLEQNIRLQPEIWMQWGTPRF